MQYLDYLTKDNSSYLIPLIKHSTMVMDKYLLNVSEVDDRLIALLIKTRRFTHYFNDYFLVGFIDLCSKEYTSIGLREYIKNTQTSIDYYKRSYIEIIGHCSDIEHIFTSD